MERGPVTRRIAIVVLVSIAGLLTLAVAQLGFGVAIDDAVRRGTDLLTARYAMSIGQPIRLRGFPFVTIASGTASVAPFKGQRGATLKLQSPLITVAMSGGSDDASSAGSLSDILQSQLGGSDIEDVTLRDATVQFGWSSGETLSLSACDADLAGKSGAALTLAGKCTYLGQPLTFELSSPGRLEVDKRLPTGARWPLKLAVTSPLFGIAAEGELDARGAWCLKASAELRASDTTRLAQWLGYGWGATAAGPAVRIKGPLIWERGSIAFGKSSIALNDQNGVGAVSLSFRSVRPFVEATVAFPALDVAPLLYQSATPETRRPSGTLATLETTAASTGSPIWRGLATSFPAIANVDTEFRISAARLQWRGEPVGQGAFSVSARSGEMHADFSELKFGSHSGSLQVATKAGGTAPVTLRGRFKSADVAALSSSMFGTAIASGTGTGHFEVTGEGATLGAVIDSASGRGMIEAQDGSAHLDLLALQRLSKETGHSARPLTWSTIASPAPFEALALKVQLRDGGMAIDAGSLRSNGWLASVTGRIGAEIDLRVRLEQSRLPTVKRSTARGAESGGTLLLGGSWASPTVALLPPDPLP